MHVPRPAMRAQPENRAYFGSRKSRFRFVEDGREKAPRAEGGGRVLLHPNREVSARMTKAGRTFGHPATARSGREILAPSHAEIVNGSHFGVAHG